MTEDEQIRQVCVWNHALASENARLRDALRRKEQECRELADANAKHDIELTAADALLGAAIDELLDGGEK